ncbi:chorismate-binding protein [Photobacterium gaetbulicola]|uniref:Chromate resistance protein-like protein n=1 Tax=Photobacterium gaetbulicola Gung47 TaxID=658445 RepID=A0A0C5WFB9_9GAMM|nr:chromate efflux transporter [Photobacterium gaetbulicola]AJR05808.1 chromate resistance protein-like protein [Photobacterium gaetbulicola Gung47]PSU14771.1 chorismate-binding protein [Photobacterium gaetbulicola]
MFKVMWQFFLLGLYSFGGPAAHIGFFQREFVQNKKWLTDQDFTHAVALCQFLPGPASSQLGMYIGFKKAGYLGAISAFVGFTFPSFMLLTVLAIGNQQYNDVTFIDTVIQAAKLLAVVVVADAMWGMVRKNLTSTLTVAVAIATGVSVFVTSGLLGQIVPILLAALFGFVVSSNKQQNVREVNQTMIKPHLGLISVFVVLLLGLPLVAGQSDLLNLVNVFYQAGSFVFGGGHVVLPLLEPMMEGMVEPDTFLSAYASAQLVPGPMFTMASYLGASSISGNPFIGSLLATLAVFLPGGLLLFAFLPTWSALFKNQRLQESILLVNASVVGLLGSAFIKPVISSSIGSFFDVVAVIVGFYLMKYRNLPVWGLILLLVGYQSLMS